MSFLSDLPSKGYFQNSAEKLVLKPESETPTYLSFHDTKAPEPQVITTDKTNILIRSLLLRRQRQAAHDSGASTQDVGSHERAGGQSRSSSGKKRQQDLPQSDSRKRAHIHMPSAAGEDTGCPTMGGASGAGYSVSMSTSTYRSAERSEGEGSKGAQSSADCIADEEEGMELDSKDWADSSLEEDAQDAPAEHTASACSKASTDDLEEASDAEEEEDDIFRTPEERECVGGGTDAVAKAHGGSPAGAAGGLQAQKIAALRESCKQLGDRCKQRGMAQTQKPEALVASVLGCSQ